MSDMPAEGAPMGYPAQQMPPQGYQAPPGYSAQPMMTQPLQGPPQGQPMMYQQPPYQQQPPYGQQQPFGYPAQPQPGYPQGQPIYQQQPVYVDAQGQPIAVAAQPVGYAVPPQQQTVVVAMPYQQQGTIQSNGEWQTDFCDMCNDMEVCCLTTWCPCIQYGLNQEMLDGSDCVCHACIWFALAYFCGAPCLAHCFQREKLRQKFGLREDCGPDIFATCCCPGCAICQEARELKIRNAAAGGIAPPVQRMA